MSVRWIYEKDDERDLHLFSRVTLQSTKRACTREPKVLQKIALPCENKILILLPFLENVIMHGGSTALQTVYTAYTA